MEHFKNAAAHPLQCRYIFVNLEARFGIDYMFKIQSYLPSNT
jgi:hypothetical protein